MAISFIRVDDRMIHGQTVTRWSLEYPCTGLIAVNDAAAKNPVLKQAYKSASDKKTFVWGVDEFIAKSAKVVASKDQYFLITKNPIDMKRILVDNGHEVFRGTWIRNLEQTVVHVNLCIYGIF